MNSHMFIPLVNNTQFLDSAACQFDPGSLSPAAFPLRNRALVPSGIRLATV